MQRSNTSQRELNLISRNSFQSNYKRALTKVGALFNLHVLDGGDNSKENRWDSGRTREYTVLGGVSIAFFSPPSKGLSVVFRGVFS